MIDRITGCLADHVMPATQQFQASPAHHAPGRYHPARRGPALWAAEELVTAPEKLCPYSGKQVPPWIQTAVALARHGWTACAITAYLRSYDVQANAFAVGLWVQAAGQKLCTGKGPPRKGVDR